MKVKKILEVICCEPKFSDKELYIAVYGAKTDGGMEFAGLLAVKPTVLWRRCMQTEQPLNAPTGNSAGSLTLRTSITIWRIFPGREE